MTTMAVWAHSDRKVAPRVVSNQGDWPLVTDEGWGEAIGKLQRWETNPGVLADDDVEEPAKATIRLAIALARAHQRRGEPAPTRVMPNREGGLLLEWVRGRSRQLWEIDDQHRWERSDFVDGCCTRRRIVDFGGLII
jgi:hypothetical protein